MKWILASLAAFAGLLALKSKTARLKIAAATVAVVAAGSLLVQSWLTLPPAVTSADLPYKGRPGYIGSDSCRTCHAEQHQSWHRSYHRTMTQVASPDAVIPSFDEVHLSAYGRDYHLSRQGDSFLVDMDAFRPVVGRFFETFNRD